MKPRLTLHVPGLKDMAYRQGILSQPDTMAYNRGQPMDAPGYDVATGCIDFPMADWRYWRDVWLWHEPSRFSAYLRDEETGAFVGEACYFYDMETDMHGTGMLIEGQHRGKGYGTEGLKLLARRAFEHPEVETLFADLPVSREDAVRMYLTAGFRMEKEEGGVCRMILERKDHQ